MATHCVNDADGVEFTICDVPKPPKSGPRIRLATGIASCQTAGRRAVRFHERIGQGTGPPHQAQPTRVAGHLRRPRNRPPRAGNGHAQFRGEGVGRVHRDSRRPGHAVLVQPGCTSPTPRGADLGQHQPGLTNPPISITRSAGLIDPRADAAGGAAPSGLLDTVVA